MLTKKQALEILSLKENATKTEIENRYALLVKKYRASQDNEKLEEISHAYKVAKDIYIAPEEPEPISKTKFLGKSAKDWGNIWYHDKYKIIGAIAIVVVLGFLINTILTNRPADFKVSVIGEFGISDSQLLKDYVKLHFPEVEDVSVSSAFLSETEHTTAVANTQKAMQLIALANEDIIILDKSSFEQYAPLGAFEPLDSLYEELMKLEMSKEIFIEPIYAQISNEETGAMPEQIYGIDFSASQYFSSLGILGKSQNLTISTRSEHKELTEAFIKRIILDKDNLINKVTIVPNQN